LNSRSKNIFAGTSAGIAQKMKENNLKFQLLKVL